MHLFRAARSQHLRLHESEQLPALSHEPDPTHGPPDLPRCQLWVQHAPHQRYLSAFFFLPHLWINVSDDCKPIITKPSHWCSSKQARWIFRGWLLPGEDLLSVLMLGSSEIKYQTLRPVSLNFKHEDHQILDLHQVVLTHTPDSFHPKSIMSTFA